MDTFNSGGLIWFWTEFSQCYEKNNNYTAGKVYGNLHLQTLSGMIFISGVAWKIKCTYYMNFNVQEIPKISPAELQRVKDSLFSWCNGCYEHRRNILKTSSEPVSLSRTK
jgi:hypothetical protein